jgi:CRISPR-associated protein Csx17
MIHIHRLGGCAPAPLAHYLKAVGILRLIGEQADSTARGWWKGNVFLLISKLDKSELLEFFLEHYAPTPLFNPWGARSGFYPDASEKSARLVLHAIEADTSPRFDTYRRTINVVRTTIDQTTSGEKPKDADKIKLILALRQAVRGQSEDWIDSVTAVVGSGDAIRIEQPPIFGTGGSEGSGSYTSAFMAAVDQCLLQRKWEHALEHCLFRSNDRSGCDWDQSSGQFLPHAAFTPWDLLLAFEGGCLVQSAVSSRNSSHADRWLSSPFYVAPTSYGYPSGARLDEYALNKGKELKGRGEQWFPLWSQPSRLGEIRQMFQEGRAATRAGRARDGWSMLRSAKSLGVNRGIHEFVRYGYQQRNNLATHFAVPLGRVSVTQSQDPNLACLDDLDDWLPRLRRLARSKNSPVRLTQAERQLGDSLFAVAQHPAEPRRWQRALLALVQIEAVQVGGSGFEAGPIPRLRPAWVAAADDGRPEIRLAVALALQQGGFKGADARWWNSVRRHWLPLDQRDLQRFAQTGSVGHTHLVDGPERVIQGRVGLEDAVALVERRLIEATQHGQRRLPLRAAYRAAALSPDLAALCNGAIDLDRTMALARALMALNPSMWQHEPVALSRPASASIHDDIPDDAWLVLRLALLPEPLRVSGGTSKIEIRTDPAIFRRLANGDAATALQLALRRLDSVGIRAAVRSTSLPAATARRWAAALAFPISPSTATRYLRRLDPTIDSTKED